MDSLRDYLDLMNRKGLVLTITEPVRREDIPQLIQLLSHREQVILFEKVAGYDCGVVANVVPSHKALQSVLGTGDSYSSFLEALDRIEKPVFVERVGLTTLDVSDKDLLTFLPILKHCERDSAPYITAGIVSSIDPESGAIGRGVHRMEYRGGNRLGVSILNPPLADIYNKHKESGKPMPITVALGVDPVLFLAAALKAGMGKDKMEVAGGLKGKAVKLIGSYDSAIHVPADAEIYLEGYVDPYDGRRDGPLGEISGYYHTVEETPTAVIRRLTHRPSPLYHALLPIGGEGDTILTFVSRAHLEGSVKELFPFVADMHFVPGTYGSSLVVSVKPAASPKIRSLMLSILAFPMAKRVIVVDEDVDIRDLHDVEWALVTRCIAECDIVVVPGLQTQPIDPQMAAGQGVAKTAIDATRQGKPMGERARVVPGDESRIARIMKSIEESRN